MKRRIKTKNVGPVNCELGLNVKKEELYPEEINLNEEFNNVFGSEELKEVVRIKEEPKVFLMEEVSVKEEPLSFYEYDATSSHQIEPFNPSSFIPVTTLRRDLNNLKHPAGTLIHSDLESSNSQRKQYPKRKCAQKNYKDFEPWIKNAAANPKIRTYSNHILRTETPETSLMKNDIIKPSARESVSFDNKRLVEFEPLNFEQGKNCRTDDDLKNYIDVLPGPIPVMNDDNLVISSGHLATNQSDQKLKSEGKKNKVKYVDCSQIKIHAAEKIFKCFHCHKEFFNSLDFDRHLRIHTVVKTRISLRREKRLFLKDELQMHLNNFNSITKKPVYNCSFCEEKFCIRSNIMNRRRIHTEEKSNESLYCEYNDKKANTYQLPTKNNSLKPFQCQYCGKGFFYEANLIKHCEIHAITKLYECAYCIRRFSDKSSLRKHLSIHKVNIPRFYYCPHCDKSFKYNTSLIKHLTVHNDEKLKCEQCGKKFSRSDYFQKHLQMHFTKKSYECPHCKKKFSFYFSYGRHLRTHNKDKTRKCQQCGKRFKHDSSLIRHSKTHKKKKEIKRRVCSKCRKKFDSEENLNKHTCIRQKMYSCKICRKKFRSTSILMSHFKSHAGKKSHVCVDCGKIFNFNRDLERHTRIHTGEKPFECTHCLYKCNRSDNLRKHLQIHKRVPFFVSKQQRKPKS